MTKNCSRALPWAALGAAFAASAILLPKILVVLACAGLFYGAYRLAKTFNKEKDT